jgi:hypothetical protein
VILKVLLKWLFCVKDASARYSGLSNAIIAAGTSAETA